MKLLIIDGDCVGLSFAWRAAQAGHDVRWFIEPKDCNNPTAGDGFKGITKVTNWVGSVKWAELIITTTNDKYLDRLDHFRELGFPVFGPTTASAKLEISRGDGMKLLEKVGIEIVPYKTFPSMKEAKKHIEKTSERFVFKTLGDNEDKSLTYVSKSPADLINWIDRIIARKEEPKGEVMLQEFVEGIEIGVSRFMGSKGFVGQWNESFEYKKLMPSNYGCNTGEMGTVAYFTKDSKLGVDTLGKLEKELIKLGHTGDVAIGFMANEKGPMPTEFTCRFGWPISNMMLGATEGDPVTWMKDALEGKDTTSFKEDIGCCLVLAHGDFPKSKEKAPEYADVPVYGITKGNKKHVHPQGIKIDVLPDMDGEKLVKRPLWNTASDYAAVVTGFGKSVKQACERAYKTTKQLHISNMVVRDDIGEDLKEKLPQLHKLGYATHCNYE